MKIIILGAGQIGTTVAQHLASEPGNEVTVVDSRADVFQDLQDRLDIRTVQGFAPHPQVLSEAGAEEADMLMALTTNDEVNLLACQIADALFHTPVKIARIKALEYLQYPKLFCKEILPVDVLISPEQLVTEYIQRIIEDPNALQVLDFADGRVHLVATKAYYGGPLVGQQLKVLGEHMPGVDTRVAAIFRQGRAIIPDGDTVVQAGDEVFFITAEEHIRAVMSELHQLEAPFKRIMLAGAGNIGRRLAKALEDRFKVKIIEKNPMCAAAAAEQLAHTIVLVGDAGDEDLLLEEDIEHTDLFCAVTNDDEANILSAMLAQGLGARKVMALINRPAYVGLVEGGRIHAAVSPQQATISGVLAHVRRGDVVKVHTLRHGAAEAIEAVVHGDRATSKVAGRRIEELRLPSGTTIVAIVRGEQLLIAHHDTLIQSEDHLILFLADKRRLLEVERLFQTGGV